MLKPGDVAPEFILPDENGDEVSLTQIAGRRTHYSCTSTRPTFTPGCTKEACALRDIHDEILYSGAAGRRS